MVIWLISLKSWLPKNDLSEIQSNNNDCFALLYYDIQICLFLHNSVISLVNSILFKNRNVLELDKKLKIWLLSVKTPTMPEQIINSSIKSKMIKKTFLKKNKTNKIIKSLICVSITLLNLLLICVKRSNTNSISNSNFININWNFVSDSHWMVHIFNLHHINKNNPKELSKLRNLQIKLITGITTVGAPAGQAIHV